MQIFFLCIWLQTMNEFMGLLTWLDERLLVLVVEVCDADDDMLDEVAVDRLLEAELRLLQLLLELKDEREEGVLARDAEELPIESSEGLELRDMMLELVVAVENSEAELEQSELVSSDEVP